MSRSEVPDDVFARLETERSAAHQEYQDALTAVERALPTALRRPLPLPPPDDRQLQALNRHWAERAAGVSGWRGLRTRVARYLRPLVQLLPWRLHAFNTALVDHLNRASAREHAAKDATTQSLDGLHDDLGAILAYQTKLLGFLQTSIPSYALDALQLPKTLAESLSALGDDMRKRWESVVTREQRLEARFASQEQEAAEFRVALATLQRTAAAMRREVERALLAMPTAPTARSSPAAAFVAPGPGAAAATATSASGTRDETDVAASQLAASPIDSCRYVGFEDSFRGSTADIRDRLTSYLPIFAGASDVLDIGCGRGEFLALLRDGGIAARGVDINHEMVEVCREKGLDVAEGDGLAFLDALPDGSLGGLFASQVIEHLQPDHLLRILDAAFHKLRPGARIVLETINPACWFAFFESYLRDITHVRPVHPDTLKFLLQASGFQQVAIRPMAPYPDRGKLQTVPIPERPKAAPASPLVDLAETFNENVEKINRLVFTHLDYAAIGVRP